MFTSIHPWGRSGGQTDGWTGKEMASSVKVQQVPRCIKLKESPLHPGTGLNRSGHKSGGKLESLHQGGGGPEPQNHGDSGRGRRSSTSQEVWSPRCRQHSCPSLILRQNPFLPRLLRKPQALAKSKGKPSFIGKKDLTRNSYLAQVAAPTKRMEGEGDAGSGKKKGRTEGRKGGREGV